MAFDQKTRNLLQRTITACRRVFDREFTAQLRELYGIQPDGTLTQCEMLDHLADEELEVARLLRSRINHLEGGEPSEALTRTQAKPENVARVIREQAFTVLNRLAALRLCEERGLVLECVRQGVNSEGFQLFMTTAGNALGETHEAYLVYLHCLFDELALDLGILFDRFSPLALLFPRKDTLEEVLRELNGTGKAAENEAISAEQFAEIWKADETIGWIYQYYNDEAERKKMRELSSAPRNSRELAVRNQFFTPRYVVEFLTDNTLGRLWYEMRHGETVLRDRCAFLVRRPTEIFLKAGESAPEGSAENEASQEELLRQAVYIPHRALKDPREIKLLDPACGSMHFGLYAFDLLTVVYGEAWEIAHGLDEDAKSKVTFAPFVTFAANFSDKAAFLLQVPRLIIEHNIHGIDIDPRATQIAGLSLWLRAQRAWYEAGIKPSDRPRITRSNIVCAEPMPGEKKLLREFVEQQFDIGERPAFAFLLEKIFDHMALAGEAGSLLRIEDEIRSAISEARALAEAPPVPWQAGLFFRDERPESKQLDLQGILDEHFWQRAEQRIYEALETYAEQAENGGGFQRRLFADDAAKGFAFIDLCRKRYDVVVMNPPFGAEPRHLIEFIRKNYAEGRSDLYACFLERASTLGDLSAHIGVLSSRTGFFLTSLEAWRRTYLLGQYHLNEVADLGLGVLDDALVEAAAYVVSRASRRTAAFISCLADADKGAKLLSSISRYEFVEKTLVSFEELPLAPIAYWVSTGISDLFSTFAQLEGNFGFARVGLQTSDDFRFLRGFWEVPISLLASISSPSWAPMAKGGEYQLFYDDIHLVVNWRSEALEMKAFALDHAEKTGSARGNSPLREFEFYFRGGITYPERTTSEFGPRVLPDGCITGTVGPGIHIESEQTRYFILGWLTTRLVRELIEVSIGLGDAVESGSAARHYNIKSIGRLPVPTVPSDVESELVHDIRDNVMRCMRMWQRNEMSRLFLTPPLVTVDWKTSSSASFEQEENERLLNLEGHARAEMRIMDSLSGARDLQKDIDSGVGSHPCALPRRNDLEHDRIVSAYKCGLEELVNSVADDIRFTRQITKKSFFADRRIELIALWLGCHPRQVVELRRQSGVLPPGITEDLVTSCLSHVLGSIFGRWDIRYSTGERSAPELPDPFAPLPICPPGMLQDDDGLPLSPEVGRRLRTEGHYPLDVAWDGILVDDPEHPLDLVRNARATLAVLWSNRADALEREACELLGVPALGEWFRRPSGFFGDHLKRYSKSRRQAPIYWPLSTAGGRYTLWLYYHRLTPDTLYKCLQQFVVPKLGDVEKELTHLRTVLAANEGGSKERKSLEDLEELRREVIEFRAELELWAPKWKPNLNDGVLINAAPLWKLFRLPKWQKDLKACWQELEKGDYDWAHLAYSLWPDRVREKCKTDRSLAIAHGLEELCEVKAPVKKVKKSKTPKPKDNQQELPEE